MAPNRITPEQVSDLTRFCRQVDAEPEELCAAAGVVALADMSADCYSLAVAWCELRAELHDFIPF